jgi:hypothetical protein
MKDDDTRDRKSKVEIEIAYSFFCVRVQEEILSARSFFYRSTFTVYWFNLYNNGKCVYTSLRLEILTG